MIEDPEVFTSTVNFKKLVCHLRSLDHSSMPEAGTVRTAAKRLPEEDALRSWTLERLGENEGRFMTLLELHWNLAE